MSLQPESPVETVNTGIAESSLVYGLRRRLAVGATILASVVTGPIIENASAQKTVNSGGAPIAAGRPDVQDWHFVDKAGVPEPELRKWEHALVDNSLILSKYYKTPEARFSNHGWAIILLKAPQKYMNGPLGWHELNKHGKPVAHVYVGVHDVPASSIIGHEMDEATAAYYVPSAPYGGEVCDAVEGERFMEDGREEMPDFVTEASSEQGPYNAATYGPLDLLGVLKHRGQTTHISHNEIEHGDYHIWPLPPNIP